VKKVMFSVTKKALRLYKNT